MSSTREVVIWHNPRCTKSRQTLARLEAAGVTPTVRRYLDDPPTLAELRAAAGRLEGGAAALIRRKEAEFRELGLAASLAAGDDDALLRAMAAHPRLIERPLVLRGARAALGRPPENVDALLE
ncbi:MAG: arsenate reductase (glutaredoxin) [Myxococcales bacterium]|nr:arsenate reductase (glutaredoxin) [Myxococcales bacterium]